MDANRVSSAIITETDCGVLDEVEITNPNTILSNDRTAHICQSAFRVITDMQSDAESSDFDYRPDNDFFLQANSRIREIFSGYSEQPVITFTGEIPFTPVLSLYVSKHSLQKTTQENLSLNLEAVNYNKQSIPIQRTELDEAIKQYDIRYANLIAKIWKPDTNLLPKCTINENYESDKNESGSNLRWFMKDSNSPPKSPIKEKRQSKSNESGFILRELLTDYTSYRKLITQGAAKNDSEPLPLEMVNENATTNQMSRKEDSKSVVTENVERGEVMLKIKAVSPFQTCIVS